MKKIIIIMFSYFSCFSLGNDEALSYQLEKAVKAYSNVLVAIKAYSEGKVKKALDDGAPINRVDLDGKTPLGKAVALGKEDCTSLLLESKADPNLGEVLKPLHLAVSNGSIRDTLNLINHGADVNALTEEPDGYTAKTPFRIAVEKGFIDGIEPLLRAKADPNFPKEANYFTSPQDKKYLSKEYTLLNQLIREDQDEAVKALLKAKADPFQKSKGKTPISFAIDNNNSNLVAVILEEAAHGRTASQPSSYNNQKELPIEQAARLNYADCAELLAHHGPQHISQGLKIAKEFKSSETWSRLKPLEGLLEKVLDRAFQAAREGSAETILTILEKYNRTLYSSGFKEIYDELIKNKRADILKEVFKKYKVTLKLFHKHFINSSILRDSPACLACILESQDESSQVSSSENEFLPLVYAASLGRDSCVTVLLEHNEDPNIKDASGNTALMIACAQGHSSTVSLLLNSKAEITGVDNEGKTAFDKALEAQHYDCALEIFKASDLSNIKNLSSATNQESFDLAEYILHHVGEDFYRNFQEEFHKLLLLAFEAEQEDIVDDLINHGAFQENVYFDCYKKRNYERASKLIKNTTMERQEKLLLMELNSSLKEESSEGFEFILNHLPNINCFMANGLSPLHLACQTRNIAAVSLISEMEKSNLDLKTNSEHPCNALYIACSINSPEILEILLKKGADANKRSHFNYTAAHIAAGNGKIECLKVLVEQSEADLTLKDDSGFTPVHWAAKNNHLDCLAYLVQQKVEINAQDLKHRTALQVAKTCGHKKAAKILVENGAE